MVLSANRRQFVVGVAGIAAAVAGIPHAGGAQTATPATSPGMAFPAGVLPTIFGDVVIPDRVESVITLTDGALDAVIALGIDPVGTTRSANGTGVATYLEGQIEVEPEIVGGWSDDGLDFEKIITLAPDVILADRYLTEEDYGTLSQIAPVFATEEIQVENAASLQQWEYELLAWAHVLGLGDAAQEAIAGARDRAAALQPAIGDHLGQSVVVFRPQVEFPVVMSHRWITGRVLTWAGLTGNELTEPMDPPHSRDTISLEQLNQLNADWLFAATRNQDQVDALDAYRDNPLFQQLDAYGADQVAQVDGALWSGATGVRASHAMLDDIERILVNGER